MKTRGMFIAALSTLIVTGCELGSHPVNYGGDVLYFEDFNSYREGSTPEGWDFVDDPECSRGPSNWYVSDTNNAEYKMALYQESDISGGGYSGSNAYYGTTAFVGQESWTDYRLTCEFFSDNDNGVGIEFRVDNGIGGKGFYRLFFMNDPTNGGPFTKLLKYDKANNAFSVVPGANTPVTYQPSQWTKVTVEVKGSHILCELDDRKLFEVENSDIKHGKIGLFCYYMPGIYFDNIEVVALDENGNETNRLF
jgi:hypothetical protein